MESKPNYKNLTSESYGKPAEKQNPVLQNLNLDPVEFSLPNKDKISLKIECRGRGVTYKGSLQVQIGYSSAMCNLAGLSPKELIKRGEEEEEMGGYFIVNGIEKVIRMLVLQRRNFNLVLHYLSNGSSQLCFYNKNQVYFAPIVIILKGLVSMPDKYIYDELVKGKEDDSFYKGCIVAMLREALNEKLYTQRDVLEYMGSRFRVITHGVADWKTDVEVGQHIYRHMTRKLFDFAKGRCAVESVDSPMFQEVLLGGHLYQMLVKMSGLTVVADKLNFMRFVSHFRCIHRGAFFGQMRTTGVRKLLPEAWGFLCPVHTPDGSPCGLMNHASALCQIQVFTMSPQPVLKALYSLGVCPLSDPPGPVRECYTVMVDGKMVGYVADDQAETVTQKMRYMKVPSTMEVCLVKRTPYASQYPGLYLFTTPARMVRPVINLALEQVEMIGTFEQVYMDICINQNEAYEGYRNDNKVYKLQTPQTPMVRPRKYDEYDMDNYPLGTNAVVAVISYTGYDMEDAMVINKASFERGFGHATVYKTEMINLCKKQTAGRFDKTILTFGCKPDTKPFLEGELDSDGLPHIGAYLTEGCTYYSYINTHNGEQKVVKYKNNEPAWVEHIKVLGNDTGENMRYKVAIMLRFNRNPIIGDKFASRHGQKGVCSMMYPVENMPFTESGMTPDIIFNPHGYPSRMTIGMMIESMAGKSAATFAHCYDATPFQFSEDDPAIDHFGELLVKAGYNYYGTERFYSGVDGREMEANVFMGVVYYQRLRHMVSDKFQVRTTGPVDPVTQQPVKGRKKHGGVRFGEMERDALISHGTPFLLQDRMFNNSDKTLAPVCTKCGNLISVSTEKLSTLDKKERNRSHVCSLCKSTDHIQMISVPHVFKYLLIELAAMNIRVDLNVKEMGCD
ncbi:RPA2-like protein [Mya arenaria]|uniref:DNA-directed RNA polymerase subunit beta n=1 Tax=Mya arenaria TaxID=6604 RepID=A0ABY7DEX6_MYAAR|nr:RPA2-like protein [Mya arenaria]